MNHSQILVIKTIKFKFKFTTSSFLNLGNSIFFSNNKNGLVYCQSVLKFFKDFFGYTKFDKSHNFFGKHNHVVIMVPSNVNGTKMIKQLLDSSEIGEDYVIVAATGENFKRSQLDRAILSGKKTITLL